MRGTTRFHDCRLSIIGESENGTRTVQISIAAREIGVADRQGLREWQEALGTTFSDAPLGTARLGYNRSDSEMQEPDQWWASCHVPESSLQALCEGVESGRLTAVKGPGLGDNTVESPEIASGYVVHLSLDLAKVSLRRLEEEQGSHEAPSLQEQINTTEADAIGVLVEWLGKLVASLKWLAALVALLFIVFALKNR